MAQKFSRKMISNYPNYSVDHLSLGFIHLLRVQRSDAGNEPGWRWQHVGDRMLVPPVTPPNRKGQLGFGRQPQTLSRNQPQPAHLNTGRILTTHFGDRLSSSTRRQIKRCLTDHSTRYCDRPDQLPRHRLLVEHTELHNHGGHLCKSSGGRR